MTGVPPDGARSSGGPANVAKVTMPQLGESVAEGTIGKWLKQPATRRQVRAAPRGHHRQGERRGPVAVRGHPDEILAQEGATVPNDAEIAIIEPRTSAGAAGADRAGRDLRAAPATPCGGPPTVRPAPTSARRAPGRQPRPAAGRTDAAAIAARRRDGDPDARMTPRSVASSASTA